MGKLIKLKKIAWISNASYIPHNTIHSSLILHENLQEELKKVKYIVKKTPLPSYSYDRSYLIKTAKLFNVKLAFKLYANQKKGKEVSGLCHAEKNEIKIFFKKDYKYNKRVLTHELGHILQHKLDLFPSQSQETIYLSEQIRLEQQADTIAFYLTKILWPKEKIIKSHFMNYFTEEDIIWLHNYYSPFKTYVNDLFIYK